MIEAAEKGGKILRKYWEKKETAKIRGTSALQITEKAGDAGLVTLADFESEKACVRILKSAIHDFGFLTEEGTEKHAASGKLGRWILDPLDGTTNFVHGFPMFCVSLAAEMQGEVVAGVIYHPILGDLYTAVKGKGAFLNGRRMKVSLTRKLTDSLLSTGFTYRKSELLIKEMGSFQSLSKVARAVRRPGSAALDLAYVARGVFDGFWERQLSPWDVAAGAIIVEEAGGRVTDFKGKPFRIDQPSILASNGILHGDIMKRLPKV